MSFPKYNKHTFAIINFLARRIYLLFSSILRIILTPFKYLFEGDGSESVRQRTEKYFIFTVLGLKKTLLFFFHQPCANVIAKASEWFGADNIVNLDENYQYFKGKAE